MISPHRKPHKKQPSIQWSIQDLLLGMVYAGLVAAVVGYLGAAAAGSIGFFFTFSLLLIVACGLGLVYKRAAIGFVFLAAMLLGSPGLLINALLHLVVFFGISLFDIYGDNGDPISSRKKFHVSVVLTLIALFACLYPGYVRYQELVAIQSELPIQDLAPRMSALKIEGAEQLESRRQNAFPTNSIVTDRWLDLEMTLGTDYRMLAHDRHHELRRLHDQQVESFIKSEGLGVSRMSPFLPRVGNDLPDLANLPFTKTEHENADQAVTSELIRSRWYNDGLLDFHFNSLRGFFEPATLGVEHEDGNIGFVPHAFYFPSRPIKHFSDEFGIRFRGGKQPRFTTVKLERLELVSLLRFDEPRVYQLEHLPRMDQLSSEDAPTRGLDEFEATSLKRVLGGEDVVSEAKGDRIKMFGAIRAVDSCLDCHSSDSNTVSRGVLLGAFSYQFKGTEEFSMVEK